MILNYDLSSKDSILSHAKKLENKTILWTLENVSDKPVEINLKNKGNIGNFIEKYWFGIENNSKPEPDFEEAGIELKVVPLKRNAKNQLVIKERTKVCSLNYMTILDEEWSTSHAKRKLNKVLFVFYEYCTEQIENSKVVRVLLWELGNNDEKILSDDWEKIYGFIEEGKAHELSETISKSLAASRSGSGGRHKKTGKLKDLVPQPVTDYESEALKRAFSLKPPFTSQLWNQFVKKQKYESIIDSLNLLPRDNLDDKLLLAINIHIGKTLGELSDEFDIKFKGGKDSVANFIKKIIGFKSVKSKIKEFEQQGILIKTVPIRTSDDMPWEGMSFPAMKLKEFAEEEWQESTLMSYVEKILFIPIYREYRKASEAPVETRVLGKAFFWSPDLNQENMIEIEWNMYQQEVKNGKAVVVRREKRGSGFREITGLSNESQTKIIHMRPHGQDQNDRDLYTYGKSIVKQSFWLNKKFVQKQVVDSKKKIPR